MRLISRSAEILCDSGLHFKFDDLVGGVERKPVESKLFQRRQTSKCVVVAEDAPDMVIDLVFLCLVEVSHNGVWLVAKGRVRHGDHACLDGRFDVVSKSYDSGEGVRNA